MREYFKILGLPENSSYEDVKKARIRLLKKYHPDLYTGSKKLAQLKTAEINEAFDKLSKYFNTGKIYKKETDDISKQIDTEPKESSEKDLTKTKRKTSKMTFKNWLDFSILALLVTAIILVIVLIFK